MSEKANIRIGRLNTVGGVLHGMPREGEDILDALYDGLQVLAENLGALTLPYLPPVVPSPRGMHLWVVK